MLADRLLYNRKINQKIVQTRRPAQKTINVAWNFIKYVFQRQKIKDKIKRTRYIQNNQCLFILF